MYIMYLLFFRFCFNKHECVQVFKAEGLPTIGSYLIANTKMATEELFSKIEKVFEFPCIVKPNRGSGGKGVSKVTNRDQLKGCIGLAFKQDHQVLVESYINDGIEVTVTVHDITADELLEAFPVTELRVQGDSETVLITPCRSINAEVEQQVVRVAKVAYRALNLAGLATFDFIIKVANSWFLLRMLLKRVKL